MCLIFIFYLFLIFVVHVNKIRTLSACFCFVQKLSGDAFESFEADPNSSGAAPKMTVHTVSDDSKVTLSPDLKRSASQGSLHGGENDSNLLSTNSRQESKNRLSFKMVRQTMKVSYWKSLIKIWILGQAFKHKENLWLLKVVFIKKGPCRMEKNRLQY